MKIFILGIILLNLWVNNMFGFENKNIRETGIYKTTNLTLMAGMPLAMSSDDLNKDYVGVLGGHSIKFRNTVVLGVRVRVPYSTSFYYTLSADYLQSGFNDYFSEEFIINSTKNYKWYNETFNSTSIPILFGFIYNPGITPYQTYLGGSAGIDYSTIFWKESVGSFKEDDKRNGGEQFNKSFISPAVSIFSGIELDFDRNSQRDFLNSFIMEARFTYSFKYVKLFEKLKGEDEKFNEISQNSYSVLPFYIGLYLGLSLNIGYL